MNTFTKAFAAALAFALTPVAYAGTEAFVAENCAGCHALSRNDAGSRAELLGPPLFHAGAKFRKDWMVRWLQSPTRIYPAGWFPPRHIESTPEGDVIDAASLVDHPALDAERAQAVADWLATLPAPEGVELSTDYTPAKVAMRMGQLDFRRFKGCVACHRDEPDSGGVSGPELYTAWERLQPGYLLNYIGDPDAWHDQPLMPVLEMNEQAVQKLVNYLYTIAETQP